jgi:hypothetical protein
MPCNFDFHEAHKRRQFAARISVGRMTFARRYVVERAEALAERARRVAALPPGASSAVLFGFPLEASELATLVREVFYSLPLDMQRQICVSASTPHPGQALVKITRASGRAQ